VVFSVSLYSDDFFWRLVLFRVASGDGFHYTNDMAALMLPTTVQKEIE